MCNVTNAVCSTCPRWDAKHCAVDACLECATPHITRVTADPKDDGLMPQNMSKSCNLENAEYILNLTFLLACAHSDTMTHIVQHGHLNIGHKGQPQKQ